MYIFICEYIQSIDIANQTIIQPRYKDYVKTSRRRWPIILTLRSYLGVLYTTPIWLFTTYQSTSKTEAIKTANFSSFFTTFQPTSKTEIIKTILLNTSFFCHLVQESWWSERRKGWRCCRRWAKGAATDMATSSSRTTDCPSCPWSWRRMMWVGYESLVIHLIISRSLPVGGEGPMSVESLLVFEEKNKLAVLFFSDALFYDASERYRPV